ncbi:hypothetical protein-transmembrane prediction [Rhodopirellula baltica SH 1]|uniref:Uncharacterized protein n=1 Tax=Rhodopirellula baltica (strain DSM 10527 / NCIMB 13988 / SH1) TaxID=243090 RepID=Q7UR24_RHOBA|nr:hypothetical protein-transmembrane prediction [Rhodopirellula baltica SH 1]
MSILRSLRQQLATQKIQRPTQFASVQHFAHGILNNSHHDSISKRSNNPPLFEHTPANRPNHPTTLFSKSSSGQVGSRVLQCIRDSQLFAALISIRINIGFLQSSFEVLDCFVLLQMSQEQIGERPVPLIQTAFCSFVRPVCIGSQGGLQSFLLVPRVLPTIGGFHQTIRSHIFGLFRHRLITFRRRFEITGQSIAESTIDHQLNIEWLAFLLIELQQSIDVLAAFGVITCHVVGIRFHDHESGTILRIIFQLLFIASFHFVDPALPSRNRVDRSNRQRSKRGVGSVLNHILKRLEHLVLITKLRMH